MDANAVAAGLQTALAAVAEAVKGVAYEFIPAQPSPPAIWVYPEDTIYHPASSGKWMVQAIVSSNILDQAAQQTLRGLLLTSGTTSVKAAVENDPTLGGAVDDVIVMSAAGFQVFEIPTLGLALGSTWTLDIQATG